MEIVRITDTAAMQSAAKKASSVLKRGGVVLYPTDTLYGLAVDATNTKAVALLRTLKMRDTKKPISVAVPDVKSIETYAELNESARALAERFLPGALTIVMKATKKIPKELTLNGAIGVRVPNDAFTLALAREFKKPFTATSANRSGRETAPTISEIVNQFGNDACHIALAVDDGPRAGNVGSTVVTVASGTPFVLREGKITRAELGL